MKIAVHITHEAVQKIGGIGSVINGLCSSQQYKNYYSKTLLYGPLFTNPGNVFSKLGKGGKVLYSSKDYFDEGGFSEIFGPIVKKYSVNIIYGKRIVANEYNINKNNEVEVVLVEIDQMNTQVTDIFKYKLWEKYKIESDQFAESWDYEQYLRIAVPYIDIITSLYGAYDEVHHFSHEYMGICSCLAALVNPIIKNQKTVFYAHEVSAVRPVVENKEGHDISFYNQMEKDLKNSLSFSERYSYLSKNYRTELVKKTVFFDYIFAVGDLTEKEYLYLNPDISRKKIHVVYNGIPLKYADKKMKMDSRKTLQQYCRSLFNYTPDYVFTHVARLVLSKAFWRDLAFLHLMDDQFYKKGKTGFFVLLSSLIGTGRTSSQVFDMENDFGWPVKHKEGWPDLVGMEIELYDYIETFNAKSKNIKAVFLNQFGFSKRKCGSRIPANAEMIDLRIGSDMELGFSIYEPFGIAQIEIIPFGGLSACSTSCGCYYFLEDSLKTQNINSYIGVDFINFGASFCGERNIDPFLITAQQRFEIEKKLFESLAEKIMLSFPRDDEERIVRMETALDLSGRLGWEAIMQKVERVFERN